MIRLTGVFLSAIIALLLFAWLAMHDYSLLKIWPLMTSGC
jgi:hypothetical protein